MGRDFLGRGAMTALIATTRGAIEFNAINTPFLPFPNHRISGFIVNPLSNYMSYQGGTQGWSMIRLGALCRLRTCSRTWHVASEPACGPKAKEQGWMWHVAPELACQIGPLLWCAGLGPARDHQSQWAGLGPAMWSQHQHTGSGWPQCMTPSP